MDADQRLRIGQDEGPRNWIPFELASYTQRGFFPPHFQTRNSYPFLLLSSWEFDTVPNSWSKFSKWRYDWEKLAVSSFHMKGVGGNCGRWEVSRCYWRGACHVTRWRHRGTWDAPRLHPLVGNMAAILKLHCQFIFWKSFSAFKLSLKTNFENEFQWADVGFVRFGIWWNYFNADWMAPAHCCQISI